ncbi:helix-turn-helix domain-containing protein [Senegalia massiliensis]|uniref:Helix-turn-helix domain-containing protein n=1 Tax=Senegalia massiliensis TaxID=1720316 RepID=A0A845QSS5_9CLOT|nr:helix-turn-helix domain-containing protein [Senegalia massiliensis]NBI05251.1 helix-turn-helix domain-containing protein [Senegalia massiliensis]
MNKNLKFNIIMEGQKNGISVTCRKYNISRTIYYRWLKRYETKGIEGLDHIKKNFVPINKTSTEIENVLIRLFKTYPKYGPKAIKYLLEELGHDISESAVFNVMKRHQLTNKESRIKFAKKKENKIVSILPSLRDIESGKCWLFWITNYGYFKNIGNLYEYTLFDFKSRISCTRLYKNISLSHFEDLLSAVAIPVAQTLNFNTNYLCFFQDSKLIKQNKNIFESKINKVIQDNGFDVNIHILQRNDDLERINDLRKQYTNCCISFLMPLIYNDMSFEQLKIQFQKFIRNYNMNHKVKFDNNMYSPIEYHNKLTDTNLVLPLWAYIDRQY